MLTKEEKKEILKKLEVHSDDTGSPEVQIGLWTERINHLAEHFKKYKKDTNSRRGLLILIGKRKRLLAYLKKKDENRYQNLIKKLHLKPL